MPARMGEVVPVEYMAELSELEAEAARMQSEVISLLHGLTRCAAPVAMEMARKDHEDFWKGMHGYDVSGEEQESPSKEGGASPSERGASCKIHFTPGSTPYKTSQLRTPLSSFRNHSSPYRHSACRVSPDEAVERFRRNERLEVALEDAKKAREV